MSFLSVHLGLLPVMCAGGPEGALSEEVMMIICAACLLGGGVDRGITGPLSLSGNKEPLR
jgi:hypothetical protein